jgi:hypothetical protein
MSGVHKVVREAGYPFTMVPNEAVRDPRLSSTAFRLLAYLMSHENGYELTYRQIERQTGMGRFAINEGIKALTALGWLRVERPKRPNGQYGPKAWHLLNPATVGNSTMESVHSGTTSALKKKTKTEKKTLRVARATVLPSDWVPEDRLVDMFSTKWPHLDRGYEVEQFVLYWVERGVAKKDWGLTFQRWMNGQEKAASERVARLPKPAEVPEARAWVRALHNDGEHWECKPGEFGCK